MIFYYLLIYATLGIMWRRRRGVGPLFSPIMFIAASGGLILIRTSALYFFPVGKGVAFAGLILSPKEPLKDETVFFPLQKVLTNKLLGRWWGGGRDSRPSGTSPVVVWLAPNPHFSLLGILCGSVMRDEANTRLAFRSIFYKCPLFH